MAEEAADVAKLRTLRWGGYSGLSRWALDNHKDPPKREAGGPESEERRGQKEKSKQYDF